MSDTALTMRDKAVALAKMGFRVFRLAPGTKDQPVVKRFYEAASNDPVKVAFEWTSPNGDSLTGNIAISTDGWLVKDVDNKNGKNGNQSLQRLEMEYGLDLNTIESSTPTGGRHFFYKLPPGVRVGNTVGKLAPGIDTRGHHGYVVAPGSIVPAGEYKWVRSPLEVEAATAPEELIRLCQARERDPTVPPVMPGFEIDRPDAIERFREYAMNYAPEAVQNDAGRAATMTLLRVAGDYGLGFCAAVDVLCEPDGWNDTKASPPWDEAELFELAETLEPSRERPIGCDHPSVLFDKVELGGIEVEAPTPEEQVETSLPPCINVRAWPTRAIKPRDWIVHDRILNQNVALLTGDGGIGKTLIALDLACGIASDGGQWLSAEIVKPGSALMLCCEDDEDEFQRRSTAILAYRKKSIADVAGRLHLISLAGEVNTLLAIPDKSGTMRATRLLRELEERAGDLKVNALMIDNVADVFGGNEIDRAQVRQFIALLRQLAKKVNTAVLLNAHPSLSGISSGRGTSGSTHWHNSVRQRFYMRKATEKENPANINELRVVELMKNNYGGGAGQLLPFKYQDGMMMPMSVRAAVQAQQEQGKAVEDLFLTLLDKFDAQNRYVSDKPRAGNYAPREFVACQESEQAGIGVDQFERAMKALYGSDAIWNLTRKGVDRRKYEVISRKGIKPTT